MGSSRLYLDNEGLKASLYAILLTRLLLALLCRHSRVLNPSHHNFSDIFILLRAFLFNCFSYLFSSCLLSCPFSLFLFSSPYISSFFPLPLTFYVPFSLSLLSLPPFSLFLFVFPSCLCILHMGMKENKKDGGRRRKLW